MPKRELNGNQIRSAFYEYRREYRKAAEIVEKYAQKDMYQKELNYWQFKGMIGIVQKAGKSITKKFIKDYVSAAKYARTTSTAKTVKKMFKEKFDLDVSEINIRRGKWSKEASEAWEQIKKDYHQFKDEKLDPGEKTQSEHARNKIAKNYFGSP